MKKAVRIYVEGIVQDVFYREFIKENAERHNVKGFVRNLEDGRVEVFLEGNNEDVDKVVELCKKGPKQSQIKNVDIRAEKDQDFKTFNILDI